ncbi:hypothetical protein GA0074696_4860 [Micromonospora purpureochromogenes]|uniref:Uncharacterized protein n=1 Tax=Micromonospora purpureochromogenes TaxID=47872 RepID=A0A1C4ZTN7_9ACTN|nr:hypothetical protein [Micromonospora purpureochromogenes]SCF36226.1 hypothetical protein GA0074696_4860 [Micromonospora purpureochromogenes]
MKAMLRLALFVLSALAMTLAGTSAATAATTYKDTVSGEETQWTATQGTFVGTAKGDLPGDWKTTINHTPLTPDATVTGGNFSLNTTMNGSSVTVRGDSATGTVKLKSGTLCTDQQYAVDVTYYHVGPGGKGSGTAHFTGTLTHKVSLCVVVAATVSGNLTMNF